MTTARAARRPSLPGGLANLDRRRRNQILIGGILLLAIVYPLVYRSLEAAAPWFPWPGTSVLIVCSTFAILALGLNIVMGFAGLLDLGYVAFYAIGAYTTAFLASGHFGIHISWWIVVWIAVAIAALWGVLLGAPTLRLRGDYLAIVTLGFGEIVRLVFRNLGDFTLALPPFLGGAVLIGPNANLTGGNVGINPIDAPTLPLPGGGEIIFSNQNAIASFYLVLALLIITYVICIRLRDSKLGRAWMAIREDETAAAAMGINTVTTKLLAFSLGASFSGFAGAFTGAYQTAIFAESFNFNVSILVVVIIILGGIGSLRGVVRGAFAVQYVNLTLLVWASQFVNPPVQSLGLSTGIELLRDFNLVTFNYLIFGIVLAMMMVRRPEGLFPVEHAKAEMHGIGVSAEVTASSADELSLAEEEVVELEPDSAAEAAIAADTPPDTARDRDPPEHTP
jgi:branched-chain amino acid transport system permease protein